MTDSKLDYIFYDYFAKGIKKWNIKYFDIIWNEFPSGRDCCPGHLFMHDKGGIKGFNWHYKGDRHACQKMYVKTLLRFEYKIIDHQIRYIISSEFDHQGFRNYVVLNSDNDNIETYENENEIPKQLRS